MAPLVVAHRGASDDEPEHTLEAYRQAIADGADALECDVRLTADGHLVLMHDRRIDRTSDGSGVVSARTLDELQQHRYDRLRNDGHGVWDDVEDPGDADRHGLITLQELITLTREAPHPVGLSIETKHPTRYSGFVERSVVELLVENDVADAGSGVRVMSFSLQAMRRMRRLAPSLPAVFLMDRVLPPFRDGSLPFGATVAGPSIEIVRSYPRFVAKVHERGAQVHVWTVDSPEDVALCLNLGVDAIITNRPGDVRAQVDAATAGSAP